MIAVDTNVLIYACDQADSRRQRVALDLIANSTDGVLLWQVACEFLSASRKLSKQESASSTPSSSRATPSASRATSAYPWVRGPRRRPVLQRRKRTIVSTKDHQSWNAKISPR
jgi:predicted nucleic acid-binding protein